MGNQNLNNACLSILEQALQSGTDATTWISVAEAWRQGLSEHQRAAIAYASLSRLPDHDAELVIAAASPLGLSGEVCHD
ncbi:MAG: hypothetical protein AAGK79_11940 [Pseudomonadota bacterium]